MFPAVSLPVDSSPDDYWDAISEAPRGNAGEAIVFSARVLTITGLSGLWGCWGECDPDILALQGLPDHILDDAWCDEFGPFLRAPDALENYISPNFGDNIPGWFSDRFLRNCGSGR
ncbi:hypothetical protein [Saccharomonospora azurea]|uniref:hypothetical protein n=1 Tax=Saccharomonospora azurea TaxID=40988 RepID=UPI003D908844